MNMANPVRATTKPPSQAGLGSVLQCKCACGGSAGLSGECEACKSKKLVGQPLQTKLAIGSTDDPLEHEADRVAEQVLRMPEPGLQRQADERNEGSLQFKPLVQRKSFAAQDGGAEPPASVHEVLRSPGEPLATAERQYFEPRFGHDFSQVRVHTNALAGESARAIHARAYTVGGNIAFAEGQYSPGTAEGKRLLAHELTHVVQQGGGGSNRENAGSRKHGLSPNSRLSQGGKKGGLPPIKSQISAPSGAGEAAADKAAEAALQGHSLAPHPAPLNTLLRFPLLAPALPAAEAAANKIVDSFDVGHAELKPQHPAQLLNIAAQGKAFLEQNPGAMLTVTGHTDTLDEPEKNYALGLKRAMVVRDFLIKNGKFPGNRIKPPVSMGEHQLRVPTKDDKDEPRNRRVEVNFEAPAPKPQEKAPSPTPTPKDKAPEKKPKAEDKALVPASKAPVPDKDKKTTEPDKEEPIEVKLHAVPLEFSQEKVNEQGQEKTDKKVAHKVFVELTIQTNPFVKLPKGPFQISFGRVEANYALGLTGERKLGEKLHINGEGELGVGFTIIDIKLKDARLELPTGTKLSISLSYSGGASVGLKFEPEKFKPKVEAKLEVPLGKKVDVYFKFEAVPGSGASFNVGITF